jgi:N,N'-diacetyllegionaminate synthase
MKIIAETAWHHEGDFKFFDTLIHKLASGTSADIIKIHVTLNLDEYMDEGHKAYSMLKSKMLNQQQYEHVFNIIRKYDKQLMLLYNDTEAAKFGSKFKPEIVEIHATCINDFHLLDTIKNSLLSKTIVTLGIGGSSIYEIDKVINYFNHENILLMFGFQNYPTRYEDVNFEKMRKIMRLYSGYKFGYADHTAWNQEYNELITLFGAALGVEYIEKHVTTHYGEDRIDSSSAISLEMFNNLIEKISILEQCNGNGSLELNEGEKKYADLGPMKKAPILKISVKNGQSIKREHILFKRTFHPSNFSPHELWDLTSFKYTEDLSPGTVLMRDHIIRNE